MKFVRAFLGLIILLVLVIFLLSNRGPTSLSLWPFGFLAALPLGAVVIAALVIGFLGGLAAHLPGRITARRRARRAEKRLAELESRAAATGSAPMLTPDVKPGMPV